MTSLVLTTSLLQTRSAEMGISVEGVPESDWPMGMSVRDCLNCSLK